MSRWRPASIADRIEDGPIGQDLLLSIQLRNQDVAVPERDQARAQNLIRNREFIRWLTRQEPRHLLVHGCYGEASQISGLSLFCRSLTLVLENYRPRFIPLVFYCGMPTIQSNRANAGPSTYDNTQQLRQAAPLPGYDGGLPPPYYDMDSIPPDYYNIPPSARGQALIRSFVSQLLRRLPDRTITMTGEERTGIDRRDFRSLNELFACLVGMLPRDTTVWCLIDGVEYHEQGGSWHETTWVLQQLLQCSNRGNTGASVRLLITTPTTTSHLWEWFQGSQILSLEETASEGEGHDSAILENRMHELVGLAYHSNSSGSRHS